KLRARQTVERRNRSGQNHCQDYGWTGDPGGHADADEDARAKNGAKTHQHGARHADHPSQAGGLTQRGLALAHLWPGAKRWSKDHGPEPTLSKNAEPSSMQKSVRAS